MRGARAGFTLLEMLVATLIMAVAVVGLLSGVDTSLRNAARLTEHDRAALLARSKMGELLADRELSRSGVAEGEFAAALTGGTRGGWRARLTPFEAPPGAPMGTPIIERLQLEVWWESPGGRRSFQLSGYRSALLRSPAPGQVAP